MFPEPSWISRAELVFEMIKPVSPELSSPISIVVPVESCSMRVFPLLSEISSDPSIVVELLSSASVPVVIISVPLDEEPKGKANLENEVAAEFI